jgi:hypothetical protein
MIDALARNVPLLEIVDRIFDAIGEIDPETGEVSADTLAKLDALDVSLADKATAYSVVAARLKADAAACRDLSRKLGERARVRDNALDQLNDRMLVALDTLGQESIKAPAVTAYIQETHAVEITSLIAVTEEFTVTKVERVPDKKLIAEALKQGRDLPFARLQTNRTVRYR